MKGGDACKSPGCRGVVHFVGGAAPGSPSASYHCYGGCGSSFLSDAAESLAEDRTGAAMSRANVAMYGKDGLVTIGDDPHLVDCAVARAHRLEISGSYGKRPPRTPTELSVRCDCGSVPDSPLKTESRRGS